MAILDPDLDRVSGVDDLTGEEGREGEGEEERGVEREEEREEERGRVEEVGVGVRVGVRVVAPLGDEAPPPSTSALLA